MPYIPPTPRNPFEHALKEAGYDWFLTTTLNPGDILTPHRHHSHNTHLIHQGQLIFEPMDRRFRPHPTIDANSNNPNDREFPVRPGLMYSAIAGSHGAKFTEAHTILSPATADRINPRWVQGASGMSPEQWCDQHKVARLQEGVYFEPVDQDGLPFEQVYDDSDDDW